MLKVINICLLFMLVAGLIFVPSCDVLRHIPETGERVKEMFTLEKVKEILTGLRKLFEPKYASTKVLNFPNILKCDLAKGDVLQAHICSKTGQDFAFYIIDAWRRPVLDAGRVTEYRFSFRAKYTSVYFLCFKNGGGTITIRYNSPVWLETVR